jgi:hypothetical protein
MIVAHLAASTCHANRALAGSAGFYVQCPVPNPCSLREEVCCLQLGAMSLRTQTPRGGHRRRHMQEHSRGGGAHCTRCSAPRHSSRRLDPSSPFIMMFGEVHASCSQLPPPRSGEPLLRSPLKHLSRPKGRRPGTATFEIAFYSAAATAIAIGRLKSPGLSSRRSSLTTCLTSTDSPMRPLRFCCPASALRFFKFKLATPKHGSPHSMLL